jgi:two-component system response regulator PilR (NtrC family)
VDVRLISATHQDLARGVGAGRFRQDLYYRLQRDRAQDAAAARASRGRGGDRRGNPGAARGAGGSAPARLSSGALQELQRYDFPGNIRELENILERATALSGSSEIAPEDLRLRLARARRRPARRPTLARRHRRARSAAARLPGSNRARSDPRCLTKTVSNRTAAAKRLGVTFRTLRYRMQRLGINEPEQDG